MCFWQKNWTRTYNLILDDYEAKQLLWSCAMRFLHSHVTHKIQPQLTSHMCIGQTISKSTLQLFIIFDITILFCWDLTGSFSSTSCISTISTFLQYIEMFCFWGGCQVLSSLNMFEIFYRCLKSCQKQQIFWEFLGSLQRVTSEIYYEWA